MADAPQIDRTWDSHTATAVLVLGALAFLVAVRKGFKGVVVNLGA